MEDTAAGTGGVEDTTAEVDPNCIDGAECSEMGYTCVSPDGLTCTCMFLGGWVLSCEGAEDTTASNTDCVDGGACTGQATCTTADGLQCECRRDTWRCQGQNDFGQGQTDNDQAVAF